ncbi:MAG: hypothetical protein AAF351_02435 [Pseudomonadota bacterium]
MKIFPLAFALIAIAAAHDATAQDSEFTCPVSIPKAQIMGQKTPASGYWFGSDSLAALIPQDGRWHGVGPERNFGNKLFWIAAGFKPGMEAEFDVTGRLLDRKSSLEPMFDDATNARHDSFGGWAVLTWLGFPSTGCWEVTGSFKNYELTFVVEVVDEP